MEKKYLTENEAAKYYGFSVHWLRRKRYFKDENSPPFAKIGGKVLYPLEEFDRFMSQRIN